MQDQFIRQAAIVPRERMAATHAAVVGVGSVGRQIAMQLASMGCGQVTIHDHDKVERRNVVNQHYKISQIGNHKVMALRHDMMDVATEGIAVWPSPKRFSNLSNLQGIGPVFCAVDNMQSREVLYRKWKDSTSPLLIDCRVGGETCRIVTATPDNDNYQSELFPDSEAFQGSCAEQMTINMAFITAGLAIHQFTRWLRGMDLDPVLSVNVLGSTIDTLQLTP